jgi:anti-anti-sigma regulatory factor
MAKKLLLCASPYHLTAALWSGDGLAAIRAFEDDDAGRAGFVSFLRSVGSLPVYLAADTVDEDYRFETLPHVITSDRREMVERKLKQLYRNTPFYGAQLLEREENKRRDDRYLFASVTNPEIFNPWLPVLMEAKAAIVGVFPLPMVTMALIKRLSLNEENLLLVSRHTAGVRQTFVKSRQFRLSRLTPIRPSAESTFRDAFVEEVRNTRMYLDALNVTHLDEMVLVVLLDQDGSLEDLEQLVPGGRRNIRCVRFKPDDLTARLGMDPQCLLASEDALHLHVLGLQAPALNLAPPGLTAGYTRYQASRAIYAAGAAAALLGIGWCGINLYYAMDLRDQREALARQTQEQQDRYQQLARSFPPAPTTPANLRLTIEVAEKLGKITRLPDASFRAVSQALESNPSIQLSGFNWRFGRPPDAAPTTSAPLTQSVVLQLELVTIPGDYKGVMVQLNKFVKDLLKGDTVASARTTKLPVNLASNATLQGSTAMPRAEKPVKAQFEVEVVLKPEG